LLQGLNLKCFEQDVRLSCTQKVGDSASERRMLHGSGSGPFLMKLLREP